VPRRKNFAEHLRKNVFNRVWQGFLKGKFYSHARGGKNRLLKFSRAAQIVSAIANKLFKAD
jgi:hypothetical protein